MYAVEFGGKASARNNVATKRARTLSGAAGFEFHRDERFDARGFFQPPVEISTPLNQNQFGGTLGGRIATNHSFFFREI
jgi:hypothetical protein